MTESASSQTADEATLRTACETELAAARALKKDMDNDDLITAFTNAHGERIRATHPVKILAILDRLELCRQRWAYGSGPGTLAGDDDL